MLSGLLVGAAPPTSGCAPAMMYGRSLGKALELFHLDPERWYELAASRAVWRSMLKMGIAPVADAASG